MDSGANFLSDIESLFLNQPTLDEIYFNTPGSPGSGFLSGSHEIAPEIMGPMLDWFPSVSELMVWIQDFAADSGARIDPVYPSAGGRLKRFPARWHAVFPPVVPLGPAMTFRRERFCHLTLADFEFTKNTDQKLIDHVASGGGLLISGATGSGKTSLLAAILRTLLSQKRMVIVESIQELHGLSPVYVEMTSRAPNLAGIGAIDSNWLVREALRIRPQGLVIGEIRGDEASAFVDAFTSGHQSCFGTIHSASIFGAVQRLMHLCGYTQAGKNPSHFREMLTAARMGAVQLTSGRDALGRPKVSELTINLADFLLKNEN